jgi:hypothetical protein
VPSTAYSPAAALYRPSWPYLTSLTACIVPNALGVAPLHVLARCTDIPTTCTACFLNCTANSTTSCVAIKGWGAGWLHAAFTDLRMRRLPVMLVDDDDVTTYIGALGGLDGTQLGFQHSLFLGKAVTEHGVWRLASAPGLASGSLCIDGGPSETAPYMMGWSDQLVLQTEHCQALLLGSRQLAGLRALSIAWGRLLADCDVALLAAAAPGLSTLRLHNARCLTDAALYALLGCQQLSVLQVTGATQLTPRGVAVLLALLKALTQLVISCEHVNFVDEVVAHARRMGPALVGAQWRSAHQGGRITWTKSDT